MNSSKQYTHYDTARLNAVPFTTLATHYGTVVKRGCAQFTLCPWHEDKHPSLALYDDGPNQRSHCHCYACGRTASPIDFVMQQEGCTFQQACDIIGRLFGIWGDAPASSPVRIVRQVEQPVPIAFTYIPMDYVEQHLSADNSFCQGLRHLFGSALVQHLTEEYRLGNLDTGVHPDSVLFPSIDMQGNVHNIKVQHYGTDPALSDFLKSDKHHCFWLGKQLVKQGLLPADAQFDNECLFGEHLLSRYPTAPVILVESPKNALVGVAAYPQFLWIATGNKGMLKRKALHPLRGRTVIVYPDRDAIEEWEEKLCRMQDIASFRVSHLCEQVAPDDQPKYDIADYIIDRHLSASF